MRLKASSVVRPQEEAIAKEDRHNELQQFLFILNIYKEDLCEEGKLKKVLQQEQKQALAFIKQTLALL